jgi:hypothetical protein
VVVGGDPLATVEGLGRFVDLLAAHVPEALPRRYGSFEPPEFTFAEQGRDHFIQFLHAEATDFVVMYTTLPALGLTLNLQDRTGHGPHGFVANHLQIDFDRKALAQPGWATGLSRFWRAVSLLLEPFYGDVRTLTGYERRGALLWVPRDAENHPVDGPFWAGLPAGSAHALVLGNPYSRLWPAPNAADRQDGALRFATVEDWIGADDVFELTGRPPADLADPLRISQGKPGSVGFGTVHEYPEVWPFGT